MGKKVLSIIIVICLFVAIGVPAMAADMPVAECNGQTYTSLQAAINDASTTENTEIKLLRGINVVEPILVYKPITLNLNGFKIVSDSVPFLLNFVGADCVVNNGSILNYLKGDENTAAAAVRIIDCNVEFNDVVSVCDSELGVGLYIGSTDQRGRWGSAVYNSSKKDAGQIVSTGVSVLINGQYYDDDEHPISYFEVNGAKVLGEVGAITASSDASQIVINDDSYVGPIMLMAERSELFVNGGTIVGAGSAAVSMINGSFYIDGGVIRGDPAIHVYRESSTEESLISNGEIYGNQNAIEAPTDGEFFIIGGIFSHNVKDYIGSGCEIKQVSDGTYHVRYVKTESDEITIKNGESKTLKAYAGMGLDFSNTDEILQNAVWSCTDPNAVRFEKNSDGTVKVTALKGSGTEIISIQSGQLYGEIQVSFEKGSVVPPQDDKKDDQPQKDESETNKDVTPTSDSIFVDVASSAYYYNPANWAAKTGVTAGVDATHFGPNQQCTRAQVMTFLWKANGSPEPKTTKNPFADVKTSNYYYKPVLWAVENGITTGTSATTFSPNSACTRGQVVTFLWHANGDPQNIAKSNPFGDVKSINYYYKPVLWAIEKGITSGTTAKTFSPGQTCTRAQIVTFIWKSKGSPAA